MKKIFSLSLAFVMFLSIKCQLTSNYMVYKPLTVFALSSEIENAVQWAINIAEDDSHGYCQQNRNGPDYDCASLVAYALKNARIYDGYAFNTYTMPEILPNYNFTFIRGTSNLQRGDILWSNNHTEIYLGNNKTVGAHINEKNAINGGKTGDQTGNEISITPMPSGWEGYFRYNDANLSEANIYTDKNMYYVGEQVTFNFFVNNATEIYIPIDYNGKRLDFIDVSEQTNYTCSFQKAGVYGFFLYAKNGAKEISTVDNYKQIIIYDEQPSNLSINNNKAEYELGEEIIFNFNALNAEELSIPIDYNGKRSEFINVNNRTSLSCKFDKAGTYGFFLYAKNHYGDASTVDNYSQFIIYDQKPQNLKISNDKKYYKKGEVIDFSFSSNYAKELYIPIDYEGKREYFFDVSGKNNYSTSFNKTGTYGYFLFGRNKFGEESTVNEYKEFIIYDEGDINLDGRFNIADIVILQKYCLSSFDTKLNCWKAGDLCSDNKLDTFDLYLMKHKLICG